MRKNSTLPSKMTMIGQREFSFSSRPRQISTAHSTEYATKIADVSVVLGGDPTLTTEGTVGAYPCKIPMIDIVTVGAGGPVLLRGRHAQRLGGRAQDGQRQPDPSA